MQRDQGMLGGSNMVSPGRNKQFGLFCQKPTSDRAKGLTVFIKDDVGPNLISRKKRSVLTFANVSPSQVSHLGRVLCRFGSNILIFSKSEPESLEVWAEVGASWSLQDLVKSVGAEITPSIRELRQDRHSGRADRCPPTKPGSYFVAGVGWLVL